METVKIRSRVARIAAWVGGAVALILILYVLSFFAFFRMDLATPHDHLERDTAGRYIAHGPLPRSDFIGSRYSGDEWYFRFYRPLCLIWIRLNGYAPPPNNWEIPEDHSDGPGPQR